MCYLCKNEKSKRAFIAHATAEYSFLISVLLWCVIVCSMSENLNYLLFRLIMSSKKPLTWRIWQSCMKAGLLGCDSTFWCLLCEVQFHLLYEQQSKSIWLALPTVDERACLLLSLSRHYSSLIQSRACPLNHYNKSTAPWLPIAGGHPTQALYWLLLTSEQISWEFHLWEKNNKNILNKERPFRKSNSSHLIFFFPFFCMLLIFLNFISCLSRLSTYFSPFQNKFSISTYFYKQSCCKFGKVNIYSSDN